MNVFGNGSVSAAAADYVTDTTFSETTYRQFAAELNIQGEPFSLWAGPVSVAAGYAFRREAQESITDPIAAIGGYEGNNSAPMHGAYHVHEGYLEAVVPLATDTSWAKSLEINGAIRGAEYNTAAGFQTSWKYGVTYRPPLEGLLIRAVHSSDIRAPDIYELHSGVVITTGNLIFGTKANPLATFYNYGNPDLQPETARTTSFGFSYQPDFIPGLGLSADYYHINLTDQISTITGQQVADFCYRGLTSFCSLLTLAPDGTPQSVVVNFLNIAGTETDGIDMTGTYRFPVEAVVAGVPGDVSLRATATYTIHSKVDAGTGAGPEEHAGMVSSPTPGSSGFADTPHWRAVLSVGYDRGPLSVRAQFRYIGAAKVNNAWTEHNPAPTSVNENDIPSVTYVDLFATYDVTDSAQIFLTGHNLFDKDPPRAAGPIFYDYLGTTYQLGARVTF
jgi:outer membrane receptor protein involved in Fe transport